VNYSLVSQFGSIHKSVLALALGAAGLLSMGQATARLQRTRVRRASIARLRLAARDAHASDLPSRSR
jgi:hypothetical protein